MKTYELEVLCMNCWRTETIQVPFGELWHGAGALRDAHYGSAGTVDTRVFVACTYCGSGSLRLKAPSDITRIVDNGVSYCPLSQRQCREDCAWCHFELGCVIGDVTENLDSLMKSGHVMVDYLRKTWEAQNE